MTEAKHTPGPWRTCEPGSNFGKGKKFIRDTDGRCLAITSNEGKFAEREANARLIAAAPDLLEALNAALGYLTNAAIDLETGVPKKIALSTINGGLAVIRAAIAKATGAS